MNDEEVGKVCALAGKLGVTIHVRGTDERPIVEVRDKRSQKIVGGIELKERMARHGY